ncbi:hypothetical protein SAMN05421854_1011083 [Amycolatopsis rubida]|uniref:Uncharacterized protein n=1 Tax=Amycolatopsis rubida TaxID=112413 RepID=A0A1I5FEZ4_9PSEU|nr:hypothetical protein SAMN05421854_1011083 [Amycolatopsis rubida]
MPQMPKTAQADRSAVVRQLVSVTSDTQDGDQSLNHGEPIVPGPSSGTHALVHNLWIADHHDRSMTAVATRTGQSASRPGSASRPHESPSARSVQNALFGHRYRLSIEFSAAPRLPRSTIPRDSRRAARRLREAVLAGVLRRAPADTRPPRTARWQNSTMLARPARASRTDLQEAIKEVGEQCPFSTSTRRRDAPDRLPVRDATRACRNTDYWGTDVTSFDLHAPTVRDQRTEYMTPPAERPGTVQTGAVEIPGRGTDSWRVREDFAHVSLVMLGVPAHQTGGQARREGESHAWVDVWAGGWWAHDPTNAMRLR